MAEPLPIRLALGGDHAGFPLKKVIAERFGPLLATVVDCGTDSEASCDYPDFAVAVAREIVAGNADRGLIVCGSGVGVSVAANKIAGIRAAICHDTYSAHQGVEHDDMNVLCIGGRIIGSELAFEIITAFLNAKYVPQERHARRLAKVLEIEKHGLGARLREGEAPAVVKHILGGRGSCRAACGSHACRATARRELRPPG